jgi:flagellar motor switch protein FliM
MSDLASKQAGRQRLRQLLASAGQAGSQPPAEVQVTEYNWRQPHHFSSEHLKKLGQFTERAAEILEKRLRGFSGDVKVKAAAASQHFGSELMGATVQPAQESYCLGFEDGQKNRVGFVAITSEAALGWVSQLLGGAQSEQEQTKGLSALEESLVIDVCCAVISAVSEASKSCGGGALQRSGELVRGDCPMVLSPTDELFKTGFEVKRDDCTSEVTVLFLCRALKAVTGAALRKGGEISPQEAAKRMTGHLQDVGVHIQVRLGSASVPLEQIMELQPGDIVLLDKCVDELVDVLAEGKRLFWGRPAWSLGKYAVVITYVAKEAGCGAPV